MRALLCVLLVSLAGCATVPPNAGSNPADPYERINRHVFAFNDGFDRHLAQPVARGYVWLVPTPVRNCVGNFFANLGEVGNFINAGFQAQVSDAATDAGRFAVNSTVGILGCFDVARRFGWERNRQDFGLTLGKWGLEPGPYVVLPFFGSRSVRDAVGEIPDYFTDPLGYLKPPRSYYALYGTRFVDRRSQFLDTSGLVDDAALDPYVFVRDAYLQRRRSIVHEGEAPPPALDDDPDSPPAVKPASTVPGGGK